MVCAPVVKTPLILALALGIAAIFVVLPPTTNVAVGPALVPFIQAQLAALAKLVAVLAVPVKLPLNVFALIVPLEGWQLNVCAVYTPSVTVLGVKPSVPLLLAPQIKGLQLV